MREKWVEEMRHKMEGHRKSPPEGLWEGILEQMDLKPEKAVHPAANKRWYWAAAAAILMLGGFFAMYQHDATTPSSLTVTNIQPSEEKPQMAKNEDTPDLSTPEKTVSAITSAPPVMKEDTGKELMEAAKKPSDAGKEPSDANKNLMDAGKELAMSEEKEQEHREPAGNGLEGTEVTGKEPRQHPTMVTDQRNPAGTPTHEPSLLPAVKKSSTSNRWTMSVHASGGLLASNNSIQTMTQYYRINNGEHSMDAGISGSDHYSGTSAYLGYVKEETYHYKHHLPIRFGLSLQYPLNDRLALLSGINYTWLYSECIKNDSSTDQHLHYLGVPVGMSYQLWTNRHFQIYASGTVMLEKCLNKKPWQWSVEAGVGAEYAITEQAGLYLEPSMGYYFNDGTSIEHYYKEHPLAPSIMFGIRLHVK